MKLEAERSLRPQNDKLLAKEKLTSSVVLMRTMSMPSSMRSTSSGWRWCPTAPSLLRTASRPLASTFSYLLAWANMMLERCRRPPEPMWRHKRPAMRRTPTIKMTIKLKIILSRQERPPAPWHRKYLCDPFDSFTGSVTTRWWSSIREMWKSITLRLNCNLPKCWLYREEPPLLWPLWCCMVITVVVGSDEHELVVEGDSGGSCLMLSRTWCPLAAVFKVGDVMTATLECETVYWCLTSSPFPVSPLSSTLTVLFLFAGNRCSVVVWCVDVKGWMGAGSWLLGEQWQMYKLCWQWLCILTTTRAALTLLTRIQCSRTLNRGNFALIDCSRDDEHAPGASSSESRLISRDDSAYSAEGSSVDGKLFV